MLDENGNEIELKEEDDDDEIVYTADNEDVTKTVVGSEAEVLDAGFVFDEDGAEDIMDVFGEMDAEPEE